MPLSASFDFTQNRDQIIKDAFVEAGVLRPGQTPTSPENTYGSNTLNRMLKAFQADGLHVFAHRDATLFVEADKTKYLLGSDHCTESFSETAIRVAASDTDTTLEVDTTTGMTAGDYIGIEMDDGTMHWTTISSVTDGDTVVVTDAIDDDAAVDNVIFWYTTKIPRPLNIAHAFYRDFTTRTSYTDLRMYEISRNEYLGISKKDTETQPTQYWFDKQLTYAELNLYGEPDTVTDYVQLMLQMPFDDMDAATNNLSFPSEWMEAIHLGLSYRVARAYRPADPKTQILKMDSEQALRKVIGFDEERADIEIRPDALWLQD